MADFMAGLHPFRIFPEEVWDLILDKVEDSQDAWNLLNAFPQLDANTALQKKKQFWLFGLVIPHLIPWRTCCWITQQDLLHCRQVCRKWSSAVDGFLESQPQLRAYHPETQGQLPPGRFHWDVKAYLGRLDGVAVDEVVHFGGAAFEIINYYISSDAGCPTTQKFLRDLESHPPGRSPFLSRALSISSWRGEYHDSEKRADFAEDVLAIHRKFGEHIWYYRVGLGTRCTLGTIFVAGSLGYLPNLKVLRVWGGTNREGDSQRHVTNFVKQLEENLPALPFLETLGLEACPCRVSHSLISHFAAQIRRLDLHLSLWRDEYSRMFPNLTEFDINVRDMTLDGNEMRNLLLSLDAPQLSKLQVKFPDLEVEGKLLRSRPLLIEDDVFQWLKRFPNMKFLDLGFGCRAFHFIERGTLEPANDSFSSLQFLAIQTSFEMNYNFLRCLPSLQHLQLYVPSEPFVMDLSINPVVKIREEIQTASMFQSNIWELLPKLKAVALVAEDKVAEIRKPSNTFSFSFNREGYEFQRRRHNGLAVGNSDDEDALAPLRQDIIDFLKYSRREMDDMYWDEEDEEDSDLDGDLSLESEDDLEDWEDLGDGDDEDDNEEIEN